MSDVYLFQTIDGGEIDVTLGQMVMADDLETAIYLSLFGGNEDDSGLDGDVALQWWGNLDEPDPNARSRSETQYLLRTLPLIPANLQRIEEAALSDLAWLVDEALVQDLSIIATMPAPKRVELSVIVVIDGKATPFTFQPPFVA